MHHLKTDKLYCSIRRKSNFSRTIVSPEFPHDSCQESAPQTGRSICSNIEYNSESVVLYVLDYNPFKFLTVSVDTPNDLSITTSGYFESDNVGGSKMRPGFEVLNPGTAFMVCCMSRLVWKWTKPFRKTNRSPSCSACENSLLVELIRPTSSTP